MHARGLLLTLYSGDIEDIAHGGEMLMNLAADTLDWYAEEGKGIGDVEIEDGENINSLCVGYLVGDETNGGYAFSDGTYAKEVGDALEDLDKSGYGIGLVVYAEGWYQVDLDFSEGDWMYVVDDALAFYENEYSYELAAGDKLVAVMFDAKVY